MLDILPQHRIAQRGADRPGRNRNDVGFSAQKTAAAAGLTIFAVCVCVKVKKRKKLDDKLNGSIEDRGKVQAGRSIDLENWKTRGYRLEEE